MKRTSKLVAAGIVLTLFFSSCTMEKRVYMSGYYIEWNRSVNDYDKNDVAVKVNSRDKIESDTVYTTVYSVERKINRVNECETLSACIDDEMQIISTKQSFDKQELNPVTIHNSTIKNAKTESHNKLKKREFDFDLLSGYGLVLGLISFFLSILAIYIAIGFVEAVLNN